MASKRKYTKSDIPRKKREGSHRHHDNVVPKRKDVEGYSFVNGFVFSDNIADWMSQRAEKRQYAPLF